MVLLSNVVWPDGVCEVMCREMRGRLLGRVSRVVILVVGLSGCGCCILICGMIWICYRIVG